MNRSLLPYTLMYAKIAALELTLRCGNKCESRMTMT